MCSGFSLFSVCPGTIADSNMTEQCKDFKGNALVKLPREWPIARPIMAERVHRILREELREAFAWAIQQEQREDNRLIMPPCTWCGMPTANWCGECLGAPCALCSDCEKSYGTDICPACVGSEEKVAFHRDVAQFAGDMGFSISDWISLTQYIRPRHRHSS